MWVLRMFKDQEGRCGWSEEESGGREIQGGVRGSSGETLACCCCKGFSFPLNELSNHWRDLYREVMCLMCVAIVLRIDLGANVKIGRTIKRLVQRSR